jgi:hypothetical protein
MPSRGGNNVAGAPIVMPLASAARNGLSEPSPDASDDGTVANGFDNEPARTLAPSETEPEDAAASARPAAESRGVDPIVHKARRRFERQLASTLPEEESAPAPVPAVRGEAPRFFGTLDLRGLDDDDKAAALARALQGHPSFGPFRLRLRADADALMNRPDPELTGSRGRWLPPREEREVSGLSVKLSDGRTPIIPFADLLEFELLRAE